MHYKEIINIVKARRESLHVSQETLATLSGVGLRTLKQKIGDALGLEVTITVKSMGTAS